MDDYTIMLENEINDVLTRISIQEDFCLSCESSDDDASTIDDDSTIEDLLNN